MLKLVNRGNENRKRDKLTPQKKVEGELTKVINLGNFECAYLFSEEGLLLAGIQGRSDFSQNQALEIDYSINDTLKFFNEEPGFNGVHEILMISESRQKISIRTFHAFDQQVSLVLLIPKGKTYRSHANRLLRTIQKIGQSELK